MRKTLIASIVTLAMLAAISSAAPATAQEGWEVRLEATGAATAALQYGSTTIPVPVNTEHPYGWSGDGQFTITAAGSCRIVVNGYTVAEETAPGVCRWP